MRRFKIGEKLPGWKLPRMGYLLPYMLRKAVALVVELANQPPLPLLSRLNHSRSFFLLTFSLLLLP
jgi:hypothetical protein